jgi:hypothetical protein
MATAATHAAQKRFSIDPPIGLLSAAFGLVRRRTRSVQGPLDQTKLKRAQQQIAQGLSKRL